jgi:hypothetical protein
MWHQYTNGHSGKYAHLGQIQKRNRRENTIYLGLWLGDFVEGSKLSIDGGANACHAQGSTTDTLIQKEDFDTLARGIELIRKNGILAGIGAHLIESIQACVKGRY